MIDAEKIKYYYEYGFWTEEMVFNVYKEGVITLEEYNAILNKNSKE